MQQWLLSRPYVEVARLAPEKHVWNHQERCDTRGTEGSQVTWCNNQDTHNEGKQYGNGKGWKNSVEAPAVKFMKRKRARFQLIENDPRDQESRNHEKDIHANVTAWKPRRRKMESQHRHNRYGT